ncbi:alpha/beta hydrolase [Sphingomonas sp. H39-1-10]|uniref:alpha/beta fold hydrolase n=1 Tax=Sphingomonas pollutisoli TaxID=3030829 RepID=UPI0023B8C739|nr:alpha/beta hydrolase [Sphingomonas pollutisoli]MDF0489682.1 alpha/beta hydrolase [Sphingomonas pollutisoli]
MIRASLATGVELDVAVAGDPAHPAIILLHGFPESHRTWRHQIPELARGHFVIAPDQRGYARSSKPAEVADYAPDKIMADVFALADHFGRERFTLIGHDWGGAIAWGAAMTRPDRVGRLVILNAPHPYRFQQTLRDDAAQRRASGYIGFIRGTRIDRSRLLAATFGNRAVQRLAALAVGGDRAAHLEEWSQPGAMTAMLNWYRAAPRAGMALSPAPVVTQPTLVIWGMRDRYLLPAQIEGLDALVTDLTLVKLDAGHFTPWAAAAPVNAALRDWLGTT